MNITTGVYFRNVSVEGQGNFDFLRHKKLKSLYFQYRSKGFKRIATNPSPLTFYAVNRLPRDLPFQPVFPVKLREFGVVP